MPPPSSPNQSLPLVEGVWLSLASLASSTTPVSIVREDGLVCFNIQAVSDLFRPGMRPEQVIGANIRDGGPREFFDERIALMHDLAREEEHGVVCDVWQGRQFLTQLRLLPAERGESLRKFLIIHQEVSGRASPSAEPDLIWYEPELQDLGLLALLSRRELEVLALVGQGLSAPQIAERLHRSEDTINTHKASLLRKLSCSNAIQLALIAQRAGLTIDDAEPFTKR
jgi:DNA-binding CsgD family transcriptional regulator